MNCPRQTSSDGLGKKGRKVTQALVPILWSTSRRWARSSGGDIFNFTLTYFPTQHSSSTKIKGCDILQFSFSTLEAYFIIYSLQIGKLIF